jgi:hypothetical protein
LTSETNNNSSNAVCGYLKKDLDGGRSPEDVMACTFVTAQPKRSMDSCDESARSAGDSDASEDVQQMFRKTALDHRHELLDR